MHTIRIIITGFFLLGIGSCGNSTNVDLEACVENGVYYFQEIGSYPILLGAPNAGRRADDVARERCNRTTTAFEFVNTIKYDKENALEEIERCNDKNKYKTLSARNGCKRKATEESNWLPSQ